MLFLLRVVLVVGALSYLALMRGGADPVAEVGKLVALPSAKTMGPALAAAAAPEAREKIVRDVLARGLMAELSRRAGAAEEDTISRDTLNEADRTPAWRGIEHR